MTAEVEQTPRWRRRGADRTRSFAPSRAERWLAPVFVAVAVATLLLGVVAYRLTVDLREAAGWVTHSQQIVRAINRIFISVLDDETRARGFALTGDARFLATEETAAVSLAREIDLLRALVADEPVQLERVDALAPLVDAKERVNERVMAARRTGGLAAAQALVAGGDGLEAMVAIRSLLDALHDEERRLLGARAATLAASERRSFRAMALLIAAAAGTLALGCWVGARALRERRRIGERLDAERAYAESIVNTVREPLLVCDRELQVVTANRAFYRFFARLPDEMEGRGLFELAALQPYASRLGARLGAVLAGDAAPVADFEVVADVAGHGTCTLLLNARHLEEAERPSLLLALEDVTARRRVERLEIERRALERTNRELQEFAYVASHDLQEPLRKMRAFAERLTQKFAAALPTDAHDYLMRMARAAERMQRLIDDLLAFSRVTTRAVPFESVDLAALARDVVSDLEPRLEAEGGRIELGPLAAIEGDPTQLRQLLQNLLVNAIKFHRPGVAPEVRVETVVQPDRWELRVADNGIGFDEKYLDRIFTIFQRLHGRNDYEGTGLGLAICRKIVERHGGRITARSAPGQGATFIATLPRHPGSTQEAA